MFIGELGLAGAAGLTTETPSIAKHQSYVKSLFSQWWAVDWHGLIDRKPWPLRGLRLPGTPCSPDPCPAGDFFDKCDDLRETPASSLLPQWHLVGVFCLKTGVGNRE
uniref:Uncharacterized protein n=1 Tax=Moorena producens (strain JHB) TaxID=1454205 RepID=A0A1D9FUK6_MOOP1